MPVRFVLLALVLVGEEAYPHSGCLTLSPHLLARRSQSPQYSHRVYHTSSELECPSPPRAQAAASESTAPAHPQ
ncbi:hypothetical protein C8R46DRAFT_1056963 [Mycena filopes]|nr:hypothetical protein C8R46DRAFT_1056963 [Mycena filopes]